MNSYSPDTICAIATGTGGAIGIVRVSGERAIILTDQIFRAPSKRSLTEAKPYTLSFGHIVNETNEIIDEVLVSVFLAPHSYTGENCVEISCHGSRFILQQIMQRLIAVGARQAQAGEFTQRAFLNGKMDLSQAEAVADLIASTNKATHRIAISQLRGAFSNELSLLRERLLHLTCMMELELDFSEEDVEFANRYELHNLASQIQQNITKLLNSFRIGNALKNGVPVAIVGETNVGKSTLLNSLLHEERALVSDIHGTTRDVIEDTISIQGITFRFIDTAGIRKTEDTIENLGIERSWQKIDEAQIVLWLTDATRVTEENKTFTEQLKERSVGKILLQVINKCDIMPPYQAQSDTKSSTSPIYISAKTKMGLPQLEQALVQAADIPEINENDVVVTHIRHYTALTHALESINRVIDGLHCNLPSDLISQDLRETLQYLGEITGGQIQNEEVLSSIFSHFCIGK